MTPIPDEELILMQYPSAQKPKLLKLTYAMFREGYAEKIGDKIYDRRFELIHDFGDGTCIVRDPKSG